MVGKIDLMLEGWLGKFGPVRAYEVGAHLAVHRSMVSETKAGRTWTVTHVKSGKAILRHIQTRSRAIELAELLDRRAKRYGIRLGARDREQMRRGCVKKFRRLGAFVSDLQASV